MMCFPRSWGLSGTPEFFRITEIVVWDLYTVVSHVLPGQAPKKKEKTTVDRHWTVYPSIRWSQISRFPLRFEPPRNGS